MAVATRTSKLAATMVSVHNIDEALTLWLGVVGLELRARPDGAGFALLGDPESGQVLCIVEVPSEDPSVVVNLSANVDEFDEAVEALVAAGAAVGKNVTEESGFRWAELTDPSGTGILLHGE